MRTSEQINLLRSALYNIVNSLVEQDDEGMIEHAEQMVAARHALAVTAIPSAEGATEAVSVIDLGNGAEARKGARIGGGHVWLLHNEHGLVRAFSASESLLIDATLAATAA